MKRWILYSLLGLGLAVINGFIFLMLHVLWGEAISIPVRQGIQDNSMWVIITFGGFLLVSVINLIGSYIISTRLEELVIAPLKAIFASTLSLFTNLVVWVCVAYIRVSEQFGNLIAYPEEDRLLLNLIQRGFMIIGGIPKILSIYAVYITPTLPIFWLFTNITFSFFFVIYLLNL